MAELARRVARLAVPPTVAMTIKARALRAEGRKIISLTIGEPDFDSPAHAIEAAHQAALAGDTKYPPQDGTPALKQAIARKFRRDSGLEFAQDQIMVGNGAKQVVFSAFLATLDDGDEVIVPAPYWGAYGMMAHLLGAEPVSVSCPQNNGFRLRPEDLEAAITQRSKWLVLNSPNNPTGTVYTPAELRALADVVARHPQLWVMADEMYEHLIYDGAYRGFLGVAPELADRVLLVNGVSKTYAMTGWRIGFAGGPRGLIRAMAGMHGQASAGVSSIGQAAAAAALDGPQELVGERAAIYRRRRDFVVDALNAVAGMSCHRPEGAFYVFPNIAGCLGRVTSGGVLLDSDEDFALALLEEQSVAVVQGSAFGMSPYLRISYATSEGDLAEAMRRISLFCESLHG